MNKFFVLLFSLSFFISTQSAFAWSIDEFNLEADIKPNGSVEVTETIIAKFANDRSKHGIIRDIPLSYIGENGILYSTPITNLKVSDQNGQPRRFELSSKNNLRLKIGTADQLVNETEIYVIEYKIDGVLSSFDEYDEFYWNVTGNGWDTTIGKATALVSLPDGASKHLAKCYTGALESTTSNCVFQSNSSFNAAAFKTTQPLKTAEGLTISLGWNKGLVIIPDAKPLNPIKAFLQSIFNSVAPDEDPAAPSNDSLFDGEKIAPYLQLLFYFYPLFLGGRYFKKRIKLRHEKTIIPRYTPPKNLSAAEIFVLTQGKITPKVVTVILLQLASKKAISIQLIKRKVLLWEIQDVEFIRLNKQTNLDYYESYVIEHLFTDGTDRSILSELKKDYWSIFHYRIYKLLETSLDRELKKYLYKDPLNIFNSKQIYALGQFKGSLLLLLWFVFLSIISIYGLSAFFVLIIDKTLLNPLLLASIVISYLAYKFTPGQTFAAKDLIYKIKCFKEFIKTADQQKINWAEAQNLFLQYLPHAAALNLTHHWQHIFKGHIDNEDLTIKFFSSNKAIRSINTATNRAINASTPSRISLSKSSGGGSGSNGSSGGGRGGGGGSSW